MERLGAGHGRERVALGAAVVLHAFALIALGRCCSITVSHGVAEARDVDAVDLDIEVTETEAVPSADGSELAESPPRAAMASPRIAAVRPRSAAVVPPEPVAADDDAIEDGAGESDPGRSAEAATDHPVDLGVGADDWRRWLPVAKPGITAARAGRIAKARTPKPASSTFGMQEALEARDRAIGLGASGPLVSALYRAAHDPSAPQLGSARFDVTVLKSGSVEITVSDVTSHLPAWREVASRAAEALRRSPPRIPGPRKGLHAVLEITVEEVYPNGTKPEDLSGPHFEGKLPKLKTAKEAQADLEKLNPTLGKAEPNPPNLSPIAEIPGVYVAGRNKVCSYRFGLTPLGPLLQGGCDPSNAGTKPQRMVRTQVVEEALF